MNNRVLKYYKTNKTYRLDGSPVVLYACKICNYMPSWISPPLQFDNHARELQAHADTHFNILPEHKLGS